MVCAGDGQGGQVQGMISSGGVGQQNSFTGEIHKHDMDGKEEYETDMQSSQT